MQVLSTNLKCEKQPDGMYLYEYSVQVHPHTEDETLAGNAYFAELIIDNPNNHSLIPPSAISKLKKGDLFVENGKSNRIEPAFYARKSCAEF